MFIGKKQKTISGALHRIPNLEHNNREHWPENADKNRADKNVIFVNGTKNITLEQMYHKLFEKSYQKWRAKEIKKSRGDRCPPTYYEKIQNDKQKHLLYEIIWQIGDMDDTGHALHPEDAEIADYILADFGINLMFGTKNVAYLNEEDIENPDWEPPFEEGLIIHNMAMHCDESTPHIHMSFIPYMKNCKRGQDVQTGFAQTFKRMGYETKMKQAVDETDSLVWQETEKGLVPQMKKVEYGAVGWIEEQKNEIAKTMQKYDWERYYKGKNARGDLLLSDYRRERAAEKAKAVEKELYTKELELNRQDKAMRQISHRIKMKEKSLENSEGLLQEKYQLLTTAEEMILDREKELDTKESEIIHIQEILEEKQVSLERLEESNTRMISRERIARLLYERQMESSTDRENYLVEMVVKLEEEKEELKEENQYLKDKLEKAKEFMKQFGINGFNMWEKFQISIGERVEQIREGMRR